MRYYFASHTKKGPEREDELLPEPDYVLAHLNHFGEKGATVLELVEASFMSRTKVQRHLRDLRKSKRVGRTDRYRLMDNGRWNVVWQAA